MNTNAPRATSPMNSLYSSSGAPLAPSPTNVLYPGASPTNALYSGTSPTNAIYSGTSPMNPLYSSSGAPLSTSPTYSSGAPLATSPYAYPQTGAGMGSGSNPYMSTYPAGLCHSAPLLYPFSLPLLLPPPNTYSRATYAASPTHATPPTPPTHAAKLQLYTQHWIPSLQPPAGWWIQTLIIFFRYISYPLSSPLSPLPSPPSPRLTSSAHILFFLLFFFQ